MPRFLLGTNTLIDMCIEDTASRKWMESGVKARDINLSVISVAAARQVIAQHKTSEPRRAAFRKALEARLAALVDDGSVLLPFDQAEAAEWEQWRGHQPLEIEKGGKRHAVGQDTRMVIATAVANGCTLVEPEEAYHRELRKLQVSVVSLLEE
ncbi:MULTISPECIES: hypothetical protein [Paraburkholderia]|jgi:hypothetical protein|uniref:PIN domain-containing protein n=1 Tax=Paraburkholderia tropica TaxID=92647 RepID=A0AAQ1GM46_9BURK|nr:MULTISPECIES: hypothetical protein [Paraburkholderia]MBB2982772.1 hypothetical protein [Paraburkholderia tropica]MBB3003177.1 hypothetical protein [Paraburkholderia tropica]MBB6322194.1 hypothetical protein [Paraburkholderia tropica]MDE1143355.1 hypothetical protein [Paraburkholderia tropica]PXX10638.1 hypothetical protein C7400_121115 [Paraburkholderia tropica]